METTDQLSPWEEQGNKRRKKSWETLPGSAYPFTNFPSGTDEIVIYLQYTVLHPVDLANILEAVEEIKNDAVQQLQSQGAVFKGKPQLIITDVHTGASIKLKLSVIGFEMEVPVPEAIPITLMVVNMILAGFKTQHEWQMDRVEYDKALIELQDKKAGLEGQELRNEGIALDNEGKRLDNERKKNQLQKEKDSMKKATQHHHVAANPSQGVRKFVTVIQNTTNIYHVTVNDVEVKNEQPAKTDE